MTHSFVRARIDPRLKEEAGAALKECGLTISEAIRLLLVRVAKEKRLPFELYEPNRETLEAMDELDSGGGKSFKTMDDLMNDLRA